jgi:hypothetical protein
MVQVGSQKIEGCFINILFSYLAFSQTWLNLPMDHRHFGYITKLKKKNKTGG